MARWRRLVVALAPSLLLSLRALSQPPAGAMEASSRWSAGLSPSPAHRARNHARRRRMRWTGKSSVPRALLLASARARGAAPAAPCATATVSDTVRPDVDKKRAEDGGILDVEFRGRAAATGSDLHGNVWEMYEHE